MRWLGPIICVLTFASLASAQPDAKAAAEAVFKEGRDAMKRNDPAAACSKFAESLKYDAALGTVLNLGLCQAELGDFLGASRRFTEFLDRAPGTDTRRSFAGERLAQAEQSLATVRLRTPSGASELRVLLDGRELPHSELAQPIRLNPGAHRIEVSSPGAPARASTFTVGKGETADIELPLPVAAEQAGRPSAPPAAHPPPRPEQPRAEPSPPASPVAASPAPTVAYAVGAIGLVSIGVGAVTGLLALDRKNTVIDRCGEDLVCPANDGESRDLAKQGKTFATVSTVTFIAGGAALGVSGYLLFFRPAGGSGAGSQPLRVGAALTGRF